MPGSQTSRRMNSSSSVAGTLKGFFRRSCSADHVSFIGEDGGERFANAAFVVDDQDAGFWGHHEASAAVMVPGGRAGVASATGKTAPRKARATGCCLRRVAAAVFGHDARGDRQAESGAAILGGEMRQEEFVFVFRGDAVAGVRDADFHGVGIGIGSRGN